MSLDWSIQLAVKDSAWFTANPTHVLLLGQKVYKDDQSGLYKLGDGVTQLSALSFLGNSVVEWGDITGAVTDQTDLITYLGANYQPLDSDLTSWAAITRALGFDIFVGTPSSANLAALLTDETGTGSAVFADSPVFTTQITTPQINGVASLLTLNSRTIILEGTSDILIGERSAGNGCIWFGQSASPTTSNFAFGGSTSGVTIVNGAGTAGAVNIRSLGSNLIIIKGATTSGSNISNEFTPLAKTGETATSLNSNLIRVSPNGTQYTTSSTMATHTDYYFRTNTITATSATQTITAACGAYFESPTISTNVTATDKYSIITNDSVRFNVGTVTGGVQIRGLVGTGTTGAIYMGVATPSASNYVFWGTAGGTVLNGTAASSTVDIRVANVMRARFDNTAFQFATGNATTGANTDFLYTVGTHTGQTASTNIPNFKVTGSTKTWVAGTLATQYFNYFSANTVAFASASTASEVYGMYIEAATAGTNATITNNYAAGFSGNVNILSGSLYNTGTKVLGTRDTGWTAFTNTTNKATAYDTSTITHQQLAERVAALQAMLTTHGIIGA